MRILPAGAPTDLTRTRGMGRPGRAATIGAAARTLGRRPLGVTRRPLAGGVWGAVPALLLLLAGANRLLAQPPAAGAGQAPEAADRKVGTGNDPRSERVLRLVDESLTLYEAAKYVEAFDAGLRSLEAARQDLPEDSETFELIYQNLAQIAAAREYRRDAVAYYHGAYQWSRKYRGPDHWLTTDARLIMQHAATRLVLAPESQAKLGIATGLSGESKQLFQAGRYADAAKKAEIASGLYREVLGEKSPEYAAALDDLAGPYVKISDFARALKTCVDALAIKKEIYGTEHPEYARSVNDLGLLYEANGQYERAEPLFLEALRTNREVRGEKHADYGVVLHNLANLLEKQGEYERAEALFLAALAIKKEVLGERHPEYARSVNALALVYYRRGDFKRAKPLYVEALAIMKESLGKKHPDYASILNNLAGVYQRTGDSSRAESLYVEAVGIIREGLGEHHSQFAGVLNNLGCFYMANDRAGEAERPFDQGLAISLDHWELAAAMQSERQQLAMADGLRHQVDTYLSLLVTTGQDPTALYTALLRWKGAVLVRQRAARILRSIGDPETRKLGEKLQAASGRLATLALSNPAPEQQEACRKELADLTNEKEQLEADLSAASAEYRQSRAEQRLTPAELRRGLPEDGALVDYLEYDHHFAPAEDQQGSAKVGRRFAAFIVRRDLPVTLVDLGSAAAIGANVGTWRETLGEGVDAQGAAAALRKQVWDPIAEHVGRAKTVYLSPDGAIAQFPLGALPGSTPGSYLLEERALVVVPAPQLLPRLLEEGQPKASKPGEAEPGKAEREAARSLLAVGDVDFDYDFERDLAVAETSTSPPAARPLAIRSSSARPLANRRTAARSGEEIRFAPLPGAAREAQAIRQLFADSFAGGKTRLLQRGEASEGELRTAAAGCHYLHFATHGYFAPPQIRSALATDPGRGDSQIRFQAAREVAGYHPGLLSGLALAGANRRPEPGRDDGILTALEAAELDLEGVELVTLSACDTGLGATAGGEGVLGLQRAFQTAGARNVVASLWKVDDEATAALMTLFYENLWQKKLPAAEALRQAQLTVLNDADQIGAHAARGLGAAKPLPDGGKPAAPNSAAKRTDVRRWAAFQLSGAGR